jgi:hypothetical protein
VAAAPGPSVNTTKLTTKRIAMTEIIAR